MADIIYSDLSDQVITDDTKFLGEQNANLDDFAYSLGSRFNNYIKTKLVDLLGASNKILKVNNANDALEGKTFDELIKEILTTNEKILYRNNSGNIVQISLPGIPDYYIGGFGLSSTSSLMTIEKGTCKNSDNSKEMNLTSVFTKSFATWVSGSGNGGIWGDMSGLVECKNYYIFIIATSTGNEDIMFMRLVTPPALPAGYDYYKLIGSFSTDKDGNIALKTLFNHETYYEHGVNGIPYEFDYTSEIKLNYVNFQTIEIEEMYCRDYMNSLNINIFQDFQITTNTTGSGGNLIDAALLADTQYYIFLATKNNGIDTTAYISELLNPIFPAGYDYTRIVGAFQTDASLNIREITLTSDKEADGVFENTHMNIQEKWLAGTVGGTAILNTFTKRNFNSINKNTIPGASADLVNNIITLPSGVYDVQAIQALSQCWLFGRLRDVTANATLLQFSSCENNHQTGDIITCNGRFKISQQTNIEIQYYAKTTLGTDDLGKPVNVTGHFEIYLDATFIKVK